MAVFVRQSSRKQSTSSSCSPTHALAARRGRVGIFFVYKSVRRSRISGENTTTRVPTCTKHVRIRGQ